MAEKARKMPLDKRDAMRAQFVQARNAKGVPLLVKLDLLVVAVAFLALGVVLYAEYDINLLKIVWKVLSKALDPGPIR